MKTIHLTKAGGIRGEIPGVTIAIDQQSPLSEKNPLEMHREHYREEARSLADALQDHLPGGTFDQLLVELCDRKASVYRIPYGVSLSVVDDE